jgi:hypothetical protein
MAETAGGRRAVLKSAKSTLGRTYFAPYYGFSRKTVRDYHGGDGSALVNGIKKLQAELSSPRKPQQEARLANNLRALADYHDNFRGAQLQHANKQFTGLPVRGIIVTCEPTLSGTMKINGADVPVNVIVEFGEEEPNHDAANYTTQLIYRASGGTFNTAPVGAQLWHPGSGSEWYLKKPLARTWRNIEEACEEIAARWPGI